MIKNRSLILPAQVGCGKCHQLFDVQSLHVLDVDADQELLERLRDLSIFEHPCSHCGFSAIGPIMFCVISHHKNHIWMVYSNHLSTRLLLVEKELRAYIGVYLQRNSEIDRDAFAAIPINYLPLSTFLRKIDSPLIQGTGKGGIHFSPFPRLDLPGFNAPKNTRSLDTFSVALNEGNHPEYFDRMWSVFEDTIRLGFSRSNLFLDEKGDVEKKPAGTYGLAEIAITVGSTIVLPIVLGIISSLLSDTIIKRKYSKEKLKHGLESAKRRKDPKIKLIERYNKSIADLEVNTMEPGDKARFVFVLAEQDKPLVIEGSIHNVVKKMIEIRRSALLSVRITGDCHVANFRGEVYSDGTLDKDQCALLTTLSKRYLKVFSGDTRVTYYEGESADKGLSMSIRAAKLASKLIDEEKYEDAILLLSKVPINQSTSIDALYNMAICYAELGEEDRALDLFEDVIVRSINLPPLELADSILPGAWVPQFPRKENEGEPNYKVRSTYFKDN